jgi:hypothetical protein
MQKNLWAYYGTLSGLIQYKNFDPSIDSNVWIEDDEDFANVYKTAILLNTSEDNPEPYITFHYQQGGTPKYFFKKTFYGFNHSGPLIESYKLELKVQHGTTMYNVTDETPFSSQIFGDYFRYWVKITVNGSATGTYHFINFDTTLTIENIGQYVNDILSREMNPFDVLTFEFGFSNYWAHSETVYIRVKSLRIIPIGVPDEGAYILPSSLAIRGTYIDTVEDGIVTNEIKRSLDFSAFRQSFCANNVILPFYIGTYSIDSFAQWKMTAAQDHVFPYVFNVSKYYSTKAKEISLVENIYLNNWRMDAVIPGETENKWRIYAVRFDPRNDELYLRFVKPENEL